MVNGREGGGMLVDVHYKQPVGIPKKGMVLLVSVGNTESPNI